MKNLQVRSGEEAKLFFLETDTVLKEKNLKIYYVTLKNLLKISKDSSMKKAPDPKFNLVGFSLRTSHLEPPKKKKKQKAKTINTKTRKHYLKMPKHVHNRSIYSKKSTPLTSKGGSFKSSFRKNLRASVATSFEEKRKKRKSRLSRH